MYVPIITSLALNTIHVEQTMNYGVRGIALNVRKVDNTADNKIVQPAFTLSGYPEFVQGNAGFAVIRETTKYNNEAIITND